MTVNHVTAGLAPDLRATSSRFYLPGATEFASTLNLGQVIKGKVLRHFEGSRYLVSFGGHERVVDSAVPLTTGELIRGRVVGLGERVEVQRLANERAPGEVPAPGETAGMRTRHERLVGELAERYRAALDGSDRAVLAQASRLAGDPEAMALVGIMVHKLGLRQSPDLLWPLYRALVREDAASAGLYRAAQVLQLAMASGEVARASAAVRPLAEALLREMDSGAERRDRVPSAPAEGQAVRPDSAAATAAHVLPVGERDADGGRDPRWWAQRLLNAQSGGAVAHRIGTVPMLLGDRLVEVDMAFFEQRDERPAAAAGRHRRVVFALRLEHLGNVEIAANVAGTRLRLQIVTDDPRATAAISAHGAALRAALTGAGPWELDEIAYETRQADSHNGVVRSVVEHVASHDSLNRLV